MVEKGLTVGKTSTFIFAFIFLAACWGFALRPPTSTKLSEFVGKSLDRREILPRADSLLLVDDRIKMILVRMQVHK